MRLSESKTDLVRFLINDWSTNTIHAKILEDELYVTVEDKAFCISSNGSELSMVLCNRLTNEQEETDTKVFLCAQFAFDIGFERVNIVTVDTDVAILGMYFQSMLNGNIYLQYGTSSATTLYDLSENSLDKSLVQTLLGLHAFDGCDTASCSEGKDTLEKHNIFSERGFQACSQNFFIAGEFLTKLGHFDKHFIKNSRKKAPQGKTLELFHLDTLKTTF